jgi:predicted GNAT family acetyltransferase
LPDKIRLFEINSSDLEDLATVIFSAFKYDKQYLKESIETYKTGVQSSYVSFYGLKVDDKLVSCLLVHCDESRQTYGIELVSTREEYQHQGYSKILLRYTINEMFNSKAEIIWLFAIKNSIAEALYSKIGFQSIAKILISSNA